MLSIPKHWKGKVEAYSKIEPYEAEDIVRLDNLNKILEAEKREEKLQPVRPRKSGGA